MERTPARAAAAFLWIALASWAVPAAACFGTHLRLSVPKEPKAALAAYAAGYYIEEKTGIEPEFVEAGSAEVDVTLVFSSAPAPTGTVVRPAGEVAGLGAGQFRIRADVLEDLRFSTVDRTLARIPAFFSSKAFREALQSSIPPKKAARKAVLDAK